MKIVRSGAALLSLLMCLCACGGGGGGGGGPGFVLGDLLVKGRVVTAFGQPAASLPVWVAGRGPFITDVNGEFIVDQVPEPYDVVLLEADEVYVQVWDGLMIAEPLFTLPAFDLGPGSPLSATVTGKVTGGVGFPVPTTHETQVAAAIRRSSLGANSSDADPTTGDYSVEPGWSEQTFTVGGRLIAYQYEKDVDDAPLTYTGWGEMPISVNASETLTGQDIAMSPVTTTSVSGMLDLPPGSSVVFYVPLLEYTTGELLALPARSSGDPMFEDKLPVVSDTSRSLIVLTISPIGATMTSLFQELAAPSIGLDFTVPQSTVPVLPFDGISGVGYSTVFTATPGVADRVLTVSFTPAVASPGAPRIDLVTMNTTFTIPDLRSLGLGITPGAEYQWDVQAISPLFSVDEAATSQKFAGFISVPKNLNPAHISNAAPRSFTFSD